MHTLVIPTFNRPELLRRQIAHYHRRAPAMNLLVLDSSSPEVAAQNAKALSFYGSSLRHLVFPQTEAPASKLARGLAAVETEHVSFCGDDDVVFPDALRQATRFLQQNMEYVCAHGAYLNFREDGHELHVGREYSAPSNEAVHAGARIFRLLQKYESLYYAVFRSADLRGIFAVLPGVKTYHYQELFQSVTAVIKGKVKGFPGLYAARRVGPAAEPVREKWQTYYWFAENPAEVVAGYFDYREQLWEFYEAHGAAPRLERSVFLRTLDLSHAVYFAAGCPPRYFHSVLQQYWPGDAYQEVAEQDLVSRASNALIDRAGALWAAPYIAYLDYRASRTCRTSWKCRIPRPLRWLATSAEFRASYLELCRYLSEG